MDETVSLPATAAGALGEAAAFLTRGGPALWTIAALSVVALAVILWKLWRLVVTGAWSRARAEQAVACWQAGRRTEARAVLHRPRAITSRVVAAAFAAIEALPEPAAREETARVAKRALAEARTGLRSLELIALIAPLLGLFGTVLGMIAAFRALEAAGATADPGVLAGGIWEALLTTAAGMAVAIPAAVALTWFESVADRLRLDLEDLATRIFAAPPPAEAYQSPYARAAE